MVWACDEKIGSLRREESDGNERESEERKTYENMVGQREGYQREASGGGGVE